MSPAALHKARNFRPAAWRWILLVSLSAALSAAWDRLGLPASLLMGSMLAGFLLALRGWELDPPEPLFLIAQGLIGALMAQKIPKTFLTELGEAWPFFLGGSLWAMMSAAALGWILTRRRIFPGSTALWGLSPGAAPAMVLMSADHGADMRLVAFMQYLRMICVSLTAVAVAGLWVRETAWTTLATDWFPPLQAFDFSATLLLMLTATALAHRLRFPGGSILLPLALALLVSQTGWLSLELPPWLLAAANALIGWTIGLRFTWNVVRSAVRALPEVLAGLSALIALCALFGWFLTLAIGLDPLTAFLATCPGGLDTVVIIAYSARVDLPFIMTMQTVRMLLVFMFGPGLARRLTKQTGLAGKD